RHLSDHRPIECTFHNTLACCAVHNAVLPAPGPPCGIATKRIEFSVRQSCVGKRLISSDEPDALRKTWLDHDAGPSQDHRGTLNPCGTSAAEFGYAAIASVAQRKYALRVARSAASFGNPASSIAKAKQISALSSISLCSPLPE